VIDYLFILRKVLTIHRIASVTVHKETFMDGYNCGTGIYDVFY